MNIVCEICFEKIAEADVISFPMKGDMFRSPDAHHGVPSPFDSSLEWEDMRCPYGNHRPFLSPYRVYTGKGYYSVRRPKEEADVVVLEETKEDIPVPEIRPDIAALVKGEEYVDKVDVKEGIKEGYLKSKEFLVDESVPEENTIDNIAKGVDNLHEEKKATDGMYAMYYRNGKYVYVCNECGEECGELRKIQWHIASKHLSKRPKHVK